MMTPWVITAMLVSKEEVKLLNKIKKAVRLLPDIDLGSERSGRKIPISCHMVVRIIGKHFRLKCIDGYFCKLYQHSWLLTPQGNIIDVYPVGMVGGPIIVNAGDFFSPGDRLYEKRSLAHVVRTNDFRRALKKLSESFQKRIK